MSDEDRDEDRDKDKPKSILSYIFVVVIIMVLLFLLYWILVITVPSFGNSHVSNYQWLTKRKNINKDKIEEAIKYGKWLIPIKILNHIPGPTKIISYSLWGSGPIYTRGAIENAKSVPKIYGKEWKCRFYIDSTVPPEIVDELKKLNNCDIILMPNHTESSGMFWRFLAFCDPDSEIVLIRDCDSRVSNREYLSVLEWLAVSDLYPLHLIHDVNSTRYIIGGCWGGRSNEFREMNKWIKEWNVNFQYGDDEDFLCDVVFQKFFPNRILDHDSKAWRRLFKSWKVLNFPIEKQKDEPAICSRVKEPT